MSNRARCDMFQSVLMFALLCAASVVAPMEAEAKAPKLVIKVIGQTADKKYPIYDVKGDYEDVKYLVNGKLYSSGDLMGYMVFIVKADVNANGYKCGFICKDNLGRTVGINPNYAHIYGYKAN